MTASAPSAECTWLAGGRRVAHSCVAQREWGLFSHSAPFLNIRPGCAPFAPRPFGADPERVSESIGSDQDVEPQETRRAGRRLILRFPIPSYFACFYLLTVLYIPSERNRFGAPFITEPGERGRIPR